MHALFKGSEFSFLGVGIVNGGTDIDKVSHGVEIYFIFLFEIVDFPGLSTEMKKHHVFVKLSNVLSGKSIIESFVAVIDDIGIFRGAYLGGRWGSKLIVVPTNCENVNVVIVIFVNNSVFLT